MKSIRTMAVDLSKKSPTMRKLFRKIKRIKERISYQKYYLKYKVDDKTVFFETFNGRNYACSPKAIYEKMLEMKEFKDYKFIWAFIDLEQHEVKKDRRLLLVKQNSKDYFRALSSAKYWIVNSILEESIKKKKSQVYVQCWHGTPLKRLRYDIEVEGSVMNTISEIRKRNDIDAVRFDYFISPSKFCTKVFTSAFNLKKLGKESILIEKGYPRNDSLFHYTEKEILNLKKKFGIKQDKKVILYAPTFRDNQHTSGVGYTYELGIDFDRLQKKFGKDYILLFRTHYFVAKQLDLSQYNGFIIDVSLVDDVNELYMVSDVIMTDYSSVFFDFANLKRPMLFYMYDLELYKGKLRDFYIDLDELPGPITQTQEELESVLENIESISKDYKEKYEEFNKKYNYLDDGNASSRVIKEIFKEKN